MEIKDIKDRSQWENFINNIEEKTFLQSFNWGEFQKSLGNKIWRLGVFRQGTLGAVSLVIKIKAKRGTFLFLPHGPLISSTFPKDEILKALLEFLKHLAIKERASFIRISPLITKSSNNNQIFQKLGFRRAPLHIHPEVTWQLNVSKSEEEILMGMRKTTRYLIRQGLKNKDLEIIKTDDLQKIKNFYYLYKETARYHHFVPFSLDYIRKEFSIFQKDNQILLFLAQYRREIIGGAIIVYWQGRGFYHHGAFLRKYPKIPAAYAIQWEAIKELKKRGGILYNFWGIADTGSKIQFQKHPWYGLTLFKQGFGGYRREYLKTQDFILSSKYWLNFLVEKMRKIKRHY